MLKMKQFQAVKRLAENLVVENLPPFIALTQDNGLVIVSEEMLKNRQAPFQTFVVLSCEGCPKYGILTLKGPATMGLCAGKPVVIKKGVGRLLVSKLFEQQNSDTKRYATIQTIATRNGGPKAERIK